MLKYDLNLELLPGGFIFKFHINKIKKPYNYNLFKNATAKLILIIETATILMNL